MFCAEKLAEASRKYAGLQSELQERESASNGGGLGGKGVRRLRLPFSEFYLSLVLLQNYQNLNFTGFRKILKKHDKVGQHSSVPRGVYCPSSNWI